MSETENYEVQKARAWVARCRQDGDALGTTLSDLLVLDAEIDRLARELREAKDTIASAYQSLNRSGARYMDPPDGGDPTLGQMLGRMAEDARRTIAADAEVARLREVMRGGDV